MVFLALGANCTDRGDVGAFDADAATTPDGGADGADPQNVTVAPSDYVLAAGGLSTCALKTDGTAVCWGDNQKGTLGIGAFTPASSPTPVAVRMLTNIRSLTGGPFAACALLEAGTAWCWGETLVGDLAGVGDGIVQEPAPQDMNGLSSDVARVSFGEEFACAVTTSGAGKCWGINGAGQLGTGSTDDEYQARDIATKERLVDVATGMGGLFACGVTAAGGVLCWGKNDLGQLGDGTTTDSLVPVAVKGLDSAAVSITCGLAYACARLADGGVACWGADDKAQLGTGAAGAASSNAPRRVAGITGATFVTAGSNHTCVLAGGSATCWGDNSAGQIKPSAGAILGPTELAPATFAPIAVSGGFSHTCAMNAARQVMCVGDNTSGQLGGGTFSL